MYFDVDEFNKNKNEKHTINKCYTTIRRMRPILHGAFGRSFTSSIRKIFLLIIVCT
jgi:hypothetical protein